MSSYQHLTAIDLPRVAHDASTLRVPQAVAQLFSLLDRCGKHCRVQLTGKDRNDCRAVHDQFGKPRLSQRKSACAAARQGSERTQLTDAARPAARCSQQTLTKPDGQRYLRTRMCSAVSKRNASAFVTRAPTSPRLRPGQFRVSSSTPAGLVCPRETARSCFDSQRRSCQCIATRSFHSTVGLPDAPLERRETLNHTVHATAHRAVGCCRTWPTSCSGS